MSGSGPSSTVLPDRVRHHCAEIARHHIHEESPRQRSEGNTMAVLE